MTSDHLDYLRMLVNGQSGLYSKQVQDTYIDGLARLSVVQAHAIMMAAFDAGVAYGQNIGKPDFPDIGPSGLIGQYPGSIRLVDRNPDGLKPPVNNPFPTAHPGYPG